MALSARAGRYLRVLAPAPLLALLLVLAVPGHAQDTQRTPDRGPDIESVTNRSDTLSPANGVTAPSALDAGGEGEDAHADAAVRNEEADWRRNMTSLRIGALAVGGAARELARLEPFRAHMSETLGIPVELVPARDMRALIDAIVNGRIDYARMSASAFAAGWRLRRCLDPLAAPLASDGTSGYHAIAVVKASSGIDRLLDLKNRAAIFAGRNSVSGYLIPVAGLRAQSLEPVSLFARIGYAAGPAAAVEAVLRGHYDVAFAWSSLAGDMEAGYGRGTLHALVGEGALTMSDIRILWQSKEIPHPPQVVRDSLPDGLKSLLRAALFDLAASDPDAYDAIEPQFSGGFAAVNRDSYAVLLRAVAPR